MADPPSFALLRNALPLYVLACALVGCGSQPTDNSDAANVVVLGAASTKDALRAMAEQAQLASKTPLTVEISTGPSHALAQQILSGAPADIYVSANRRWADEVQRAGLAAESIDWLGNALVVIVPSESNLNLDGLEDLLSEKVARVAVAGENVPAGIYAKQALTYYQLWEPLAASGKLVRGHDVRSTLAYAERGEVDAAIVYGTDARLTDRVRIVARLDPASHAAIVYSLVRVAAVDASPAADKFFEFLQGSAAQKIAEDFGFVALRSTDREVE